MIEAFFVNPLVQNSNSFLDDLRRLNQLRDASDLKDIIYTKEIQSATIKLKR